MMSREFQPCFAALLLLISGCSLAVKRPARHQGTTGTESPEAIRNLHLDLDVVRSVQVLKSRALGAESSTLIIRLSEPMDVLSTLEGWRHRVRFIGDHYLPPATWKPSHDITLDELKKRVCDAVSVPVQSTSLLYTGVPMRYACVRTAEFKEMRICALVTAGVVSNSLRMSVDEGTYYEPGTINILLLTNMKLSPRAMARAIITATEAKTACLEDLDIRSSAGPARQATGTGTDNLIVVSGRGRAITSTGGHSRMGQLIARAVYDAVKDAIRLENGIEAGRSVLARLKERKINLRELARSAARQAGYKGDDLEAKLEKVLSEPRCAAFMESSFAISDAHQRGLLSSLDVFDGQCRQFANDLAGHPVRWISFEHRKTTPPALRIALDAVLNGTISPGE